MSWMDILHNSSQNGESLKELLRLSDEEALKIDEISRQYPMFINSYYLSLINPEDKEDPIRKMSVPSLWELEAGGDADTSGEGTNTVLPGLQHKYAQTALILSTNRCAMYCRHCFRKRLVGLEDDEIARHLDEMVSYIKAHPLISNVLISGGDAFLNSNERIGEYLERFTGLEQLDFIRFGTRTPVVLPQRMTQDDEFLRMLERYAERKQIYVVTQFNHPREITPEAAAAVKALTKIGIIVRNQTVLLKEINDDPAVLGTLLRKLTANRVVPYYIFQCRPVRGVLNHFQVPLHKGVRIVDEARAMQNGQGKSVRFVMSHRSGKIEILGHVSDEEMLFKYQQAKEPQDQNRLFRQKIEREQCWLD